MFTEAKKYFIDTYWKGSIVNDNKGLIKNLDVVKIIKDGFYRLHFDRIYATSPFVASHGFRNHMFITSSVHTYDVYATYYLSFRGVHGVH